MTEKRQISQGYIIRILQHFATKLWNITNFVMFFQAVMKFLSRSKFSLLRIWSIQRPTNYSHYNWTCTKKTATQSKNMDCKKGMSRYAH
jgi:hypothetical protein